MAKEIAKKVGKLTIYADGTFKVGGVVLAYPTLLRAKPVMDNPQPKFTVAALLPKDTHDAEIKALREFIQKACTEKKLGKLPSDKICLRDGDDLGKEAYEPYWRLNMGANETHPPVLRINGEKKNRGDDADELEEVAKTGNVAQVLGSLYLQDNQYGKRANCNLIAVNFSDDFVEIALGGGAEDDDDIWEDDEDL